MLNHPDERSRMGECGRARVLERFNWNTVVDRCIEAYAA